ncbi:MAG: methyl-accepting chemotaxis protein, partial [Betaproteobacteria bacterium]|nr:methyl-accepting chemotaxis protein [Betaproteobacteria bacterium]
EEQATGMQQINQAVAQLNAVTQQNASASEELAATAEEMNAQASQLQDTMLVFKLDAEASRETEAETET